jgi:hypothetical protein
MATCNSCHREIRWAKSATTGKSMPLDPEPTPDGNLVVERGVFRAATAEDKRLHRDLFVSHFSTCPQAEKWRRG